MSNKLINGIPDAKRSLLRQLEDLLPEIEDGLAKGHSHAAMHAALPGFGINIGLPYYHRALNMLRKERREGKNRSGAIQPRPRIKVQNPAPAPADAKAPNFSVALAKGPQEAAGTITVESSGPKPFTWSGREFLDKDWSDF